MDLRFRDLDEKIYPEIKVNSGEKRLDPPSPETARLERGGGRPGSGRTPAGRPDLAPGGAGGADPRQWRPDRGGGGKWIDGEVPVAAAARRATRR